MKNAKSTTEWPVSVSHTFQVQRHDVTFVAVEGEPELQMQSQIPARILAALTPYEKSLFDAAATRVIKKLRHQCGHRVAMFVPTNWNFD